MSEPRPAARRADAQHNRERILAVSYAAFAADPEVSLNAVAKLAGVGAGTLYRHFPTREALILAVYRQEVQTLVEAVDGVLAEHAPMAALRTWLLRLADLVRVKHGLGDALQSEAAKDVVDETYAPVTSAIGVLLRAGERTGEVRPDLNPADVLLLMGVLWRVAPDDAGRLLTLAIQGLRPSL